jgi:predicted RecA/RadA family phage recombinase
MTTRFVSEGCVVDHTPTVAVANGRMVVIGAKVALALVDIAANTTGSAQVAGVFSYPKLSTDVVAQGALLYFDSANNRLTTTVGSNVLAGWAWDAAGAGTTSANILLNGQGC